MSETIWNLRDVTLAGGTKPRLDGVSVGIGAGVTAVMGSSGAGKSSLLGLLSGFEKPDSGNIRFVSPVTDRKLARFWSPQDHGLWPHLNVCEHLEYVRPTASRTGRTVEQWLDLFQLASLSRSLPGTLSQGERSRLSVARALASEAAVLIMDEPMVHVDPLMAHQCWQIIDDHVQRYCDAIVFSAHDPDTVLRYARRVICLNKGRITYAGSIRQLYLEPLTKELGWLLGPCNWFTRRETAHDCPLEVIADAEKAFDRLNTDRTDAGVLRLRPSQLELQSDARSRFEVRTIRPAASCMEVRLHDIDSGQCHEVFVGQIPDDVYVGDAVSVVVQSTCSGILKPVPVDS